MSLKLVLEMEAGDGVVGDNDEVEAANTATEVEATTSELGDIDGEVSEYSDGIDASVGATEELGEVNDVLAAGVESGEGVSEETAKMAEIAVEAICAKVGISAREARIMPAMESFGSTNSRLTATRLAMEGIKETAKRVWEAIKKACIHVWNVIKSFFAGLFKSRSMLEKHLKNLKDRANVAKGDPKEKKMSSGAKAFSVKGKATVDNVAKVLADSLQMLTISVTISEQLASNTAAVLVNDDLVYNAYDMFTKLPAGMDESKAGKGGKAYGSLVNGRAIVVTLDKSDKKEHKTSINVEVVEKNFAKEIEAPTKVQILQVIDAAQATLKALINYDKVSKNLEKINKTLVNTTDTILSEMNKGSDNLGETVPEEKTKQQDNVRAINSLIAKLGTACPNLVFSACKSAADYANAGINNLGEKDKKK